MQFIFYNIRDFVIKFFSVSADGNISVWRTVGKFVINIGNICRLECYFFESGFFDFYTGKV